VLWRIGEYWRFAGRRARQANEMMVVLANLIVSDFRFSGGTGQLSQMGIVFACRLNPLSAAVSCYQRSRVESSGSRSQKLSNDNHDHNDNHSRTALLLLPPFFLSLPLSTLEIKLLIFTRLKPQIALLYPSSSSRAQIAKGEYPPRHSPHADASSHHPALTATI
jgi:hypothetical protein